MERLYYGGKQFFLLHVKINEVADKISWHAQSMVLL